MTVVIPAYFLSVEEWHIDRGSSRNAVSCLCIARSRIKGADCSSMKNVLGRVAGVAKGVFQELNAGALRSISTVHASQLPILAGTAIPADAATPAVLPAAEPEDDEELESLLQQISDSRHAGERRDAMGRLKDLLMDNPRVRLFS